MRLIIVARPSASSVDPSPGFEPTCIRMMLPGRRAASARASTLATDWPPLVPSHPPVSTVQPTAAYPSELTIRNVRAQLEDRLQGASDTTLASSARALTGRLSAIEEALYQVRNRSFQDPLNFPPGLVERISGLSGVVASIDARPTAQAYDVYRMFAAELQRQLLALRAALGSDLQTVNAALRAANASRIVPRTVELRRPAPEVAK